jgi:hypothetical protein
MKFKFDKFNPRRAMRGVEAASVVVDDPADQDGPCMLWMSKSDIGRNMIVFGRDQALVEAWDAYAAYEARASSANQDDLCRRDGRCQYAIECGMEGVGHCPRGKCAMPATLKRAEDMEPNDLGLSHWPC